MAPGSSIAAPEAVQVLVSSLADDSSAVRDASMASLKDIAALNPLLVLECCAVVSRGGLRRLGNMAGVFQVMAFGVRSLDRREVDDSFIAKLAKIATAEMISSKDSAVNDFIRCCMLLMPYDQLVLMSSLIHGDCSAGNQFRLATISIRSTCCNWFTFTRPSEFYGMAGGRQMMEETFLHLSGPNSALLAMVQILAKFASTDPLQFIPRWKGVLSRILPILGNVRDVHQPIFANAFKCWCQAA